MFAGALDTKLKIATGEFPATIRRNHKTHPIFVLKSIHGTSHQVCPCSSKGSRSRQRYIPKGCKLEMRETVTERDSFLVEKYSFILPENLALAKEMFFLGRKKY